MVAILATYKLDEQLMRKFLDMNKPAFEANDVRVIMVCDRDIDLGYSWAKTLLYPKQLETFALSKTINYAIKRAETEGIIIKTDVDIYFTTEVLKYIKSTVKYKQALICKCANRNGLENAKTAKWENCNKRTKGRGACFAMTKQDWFDFKGYNEKIIGWGGEDCEMYRRVSSRINLKESIEKPLYHINHPDRRNNSNGWWFVNSSTNLKIGKPMDWGNDDWGEAIDR